MPNPIQDIRKKGMDPAKVSREADDYCAACGYSHGSGQSCPMGTPRDYRANPVNPTPPGAPAKNLK